VRALPIRKRTRFAPPSSHIFCTSSSLGVAEVSGKPPGTWSGVSGCGGLEASPTVSRHCEALSISRSCSMGCRCSPYMLPGRNSTLHSRWGQAGILTAGGCSAFWQCSARPGCCGARGGGFLAGEGVLGAGGGTGDGVWGGFIWLGSSSGAWGSLCFGSSSCAWGCG